MFQGRYIPDLYDWYDLCDLCDLVHVCRAGSAEICVILDLFPGLDLFYSTQILHKILVTAGYDILIFYGGA